MASKLFAPFHLPSLASFWSSVAISRIQYIFRYLHGITPAAFPQ
ncbi:hypothetical protein BSM4216_2571 [Bacillus smithii]|nr:hypothetical protein BSM4216_2571 [Bacillus smithii]